VSGAAPSKNFVSAQAFFAKPVAHSSAPAQNANKEVETAPAGSAIDTSRPVKSTLETSMERRRKAAANTPDAKKSLPEAPPKDTTTIAPEDATAGSRPKRPDLLSQIQSFKPATLKRRTIEPCYSPFYKFVSFLPILSKFVYSNKSQTNQTNLNPPADNQCTPLGRASEISTLENQNHCHAAGAVCGVLSMAAIVALVATKIITGFVLACFACGIFLYSFSLAGYSINQILTNNKKINAYEPPKNDNPIS